MELEACAVAELDLLRKDWETLSFEFDIKRIKLRGGDWFEFESESNTCMIPEKGRREVYVYFHHDDMDEEDLAYFSIDADFNNLTVVLKPGNLNVERIEIDNISCTQQEPITPAKGAR